MALNSILLLAVIVIFSVFCSIQDIKHMEVNNYSLWCACGAVFVLQIVIDYRTCWIYLLSGVLSGLLYFAVRKISKGKLGMADVYFGIFQGLCLPFFWIPICIAVEILLVLIIINKRLKNQKFPFIPFMASALVITFIVQNLF